MGRQAKGVRLIRLEEDRKLAGCAVIQGSPDDQAPDGMVQEGAVSITSTETDLSDLTEESDLRTPGPLDHDLDRDDLGDTDEIEIEEPLHEEEGD